MSGPGNDSAAAATAMRTCRKCRVHEVFSPMSGHQQRCPFVNCGCRGCELIEKQTRKQRQARQASLGPSQIRTQRTFSLIQMEEEYRAARQRLGQMEKEYRERQRPKQIQLEDEERRNLYRRARTTCVTPTVIGASEQPLGSEPNNLTVVPLLTLDGDAVEPCQHFVVTERTPLQGPKSCKLCRRHNAARSHAGSICPYANCKCRPACRRRARSKRLELKFKRLDHNCRMEALLLSATNGTDSTGSANDAPAATQERAQRITETGKDGAVDIDRLPGPGPPPSGRRVSGLVDANTPSQPSKADEQVAGQPADVTALDQAMNKLCIECSAPLASEAELQDHVDTVHMELIPILRMAHIFKIMREAAWPSSGSKEGRELNYAA